VDLSVLGLVNTNLDVNAIATLDGTIRLDFAFTPNVGEVVTVFSYDGRSGEFDSVVGAGLAAGFVLTPIYGTDSFQIGVAAIPEPETYALMLTGLGVVLWAGRRRRGARAVSPMASPG
jgi:hypothetical protein